MIECFSFISSSSFIITYSVVPPICSSFYLSVLLYIRMYKAQYKLKQYTSDRKRPIIVTQKNSVSKHASTTADRCNSSQHLNKIVMSSKGNIWIIRTSKKMNIPMRFGIFFSSSQHRFRWPHTKMCDAKTYSVSSCTKNTAEHLISYQAFKSIWVFLGSANLKKYATFFNYSRERILVTYFVWVCRQHIWQLNRI